MQVKPTCVSTYANPTSSGGTRIPTAALSHSCRAEPVNIIKGDIRPIPGSTQTLRTKVSFLHDCLPGGWMALVNSRWT